MDIVCNKSPGCNDDYKIALAMSEQAEYTSNLEEEDLTIRKRRKRRVEVLSSSDSEDSDDDEGHQTKRLTLNSSFSLPIPPQYEDCTPSSKPGSSTGKKRHAPSELPLRSLVSSHNRRNLITDEPSLALTAFEATTTRRLDKIEMDLKILSAKLINILENQQTQMVYLHKLSTSAVADPEPVDVNLAPFRDVLNFEEFCGKLDNSQDFKKNLTTFLCALGGRNPASCLRLMLRKIGTSELWSQYSLKGKKGKKSLQPLSIYSVITKCWLTLNKDGKLHQLDGAITDFLKNAPKGLQKHKENENKIMLEQDQLCEPDGEASQFEC